METGFPPLANSGFVTHAISASSKREAGHSSLNSNCRVKCEQEKLRWQIYPRLTRPSRRRCKETLAMNALLKAFNAGLVPLLEAEGFKKRSGEIFTRNLAEGFSGWLGLNRARRRDGFELNPVVGVRCQELEGLLSTLMTERQHTYIPPTVAISLGYRMPDRTYRSWTIQEDTIADDCADIVAAVVQYGVPFMASACTLPALGTLLESPGFTSVEQASFRRPLIKWLLGD